MILNPLFRPLKGVLELVAAGNPCRVIRPVEAVDRGLGRGSMSLRAIFFPHRRLIRSWSIMDRFGRRQVERVQDRFCLGSLMVTVPWAAPARRSPFVASMRTTAVRLESEITSEWACRTPSRIGARKFSFSSVV